MVICRSMDNGILGIFAKRDDAEKSFKSAYPNAVFDGVTVKESAVEKAPQVGWITEHGVERQAIDFRPLIPVQEAKRLGLS